MSHVAAKIFVGTFHKTGTVLMYRILDQASKRLDRVLWRKDLDEQTPENWTICFHDHSQFGDEPGLNPVRGVLVVRDPRDVIISGAHYHCEAFERWLNEPNPAFGGASYRERISALPTDDDKYLFEMEHTGADTIRQMLAAIEAYPQFRVFKFEDLVTDLDLMTFRQMFTHLGFQAAEIPALLSIAYENSVFSGRVGNSVHVRSGKPEQWKTAFSASVRRQFRERFPDAPEKLGYEATTD